MVTHVVFRAAFVPADGKSHWRGLRKVVREQGRDVSFGDTLREFVSASFQAKCGGGGEATTPQRKRTLTPGEEPASTTPLAQNGQSSHEGRGKMAWDCCNPTSFYVIVGF